MPRLMARPQAQLLMCSVSPAISEPMNIRLCVDMAQLVQIEDGVPDASSSFPWDDRAAAMDAACRWLQLHHRDDLLHL